MDINLHQLIPLFIELKLNRSCYKINELRNRIRACLTIEVHSDVQNEVTPGI